MCITAVYDLTEMDVYVYNYVYGVTNMNVYVDKCVCVENVEKMVWGEGENLDPSWFMNLFIIGVQYS